MSKYPIHRDFKKFENIKPKICRSFLPLINKTMSLRLIIERDDEDINVLHKKIKVGYKESISVLIYEPKKFMKNAPCLLYIHGGGFMLKAEPYHYNLARRYSKEGQCKVVFVDYRLAPKYKYPIPFNDCVDTLKWIVKNSDKLGIDKDKIAVGGDSAGGNIAAGLSLKARDDLKVNLSFILLIYPVIDRRMNTKSMKRYTDTPLCNTELCKKMWQYYLGDIKRKDIKYTSLLEGNDFYNLPKTYIETAEFDCLHDEALIYGDELKKSGNYVEIKQTYQTIHAYDMELGSKVVENSVNKRISFIRKGFHLGYN